jgi:hypothetical protein
MGKTSEANGKADSVSMVCVLIPIFLLIQLVLNMTILFYALDLPNNHTCPHPWALLLMTWQ